MTGRALTALSHDECWSLLRDRAVARLAWVDAGLPEIRPVNYRVLGQRIVLRAVPGTWDEQVHDAVVVLEVDDVDEASRAGRSVVLRGTARVLRTGSSELRAAAGECSWLTDRVASVLVTPAEVSGRWLLPDGE